MRNLPGFRLHNLFCFYFHPFLKSKHKSVGFIIVIRTNCLRCFVLLIFLLLPFHNYHLCYVLLLRSLNLLPSFFQSCLSFTKCILRLMFHRLFQKFLFQELKFMNFIGNLLSAKIESLLYNQHSYFRTFLIFDYRFSLADCLCKLFILI